MLRWVKLNQNKLLEYKFPEKDNANVNQYKCAVHNWIFANVFGKSAQIIFNTLNAVEFERNTIMFTEVV